MSTHYLVSHFNDEINDVVGASGVSPQTLVVGNYLIRVPDDVAVQNPTNVADLITQKYAGVLGNSGLFTQVIYDDMLDGSGVDTGASTGVLLGDKGSVGVFPKDGSHIPVLQTTPYGIVWGGMGAGPVQAVMTYELFEYIDTDDKDVPYVREYKEVTPDVDVSAQVSFDGGTTFFNTADKAMVNIPGGSTGTQVVLKFTRNTNIGVRGRVFLGSWAVLF